MNTKTASKAPAEAPANCGLCPRLVEFREKYRSLEPDWFNAPVPSFGKPSARLLIVGLAPGLRGANRTGRPFTGDHAGDLLYATLLKFGFAKGTYKATPDDGLTLVDCMISNAVRCVPPENKPTTSEISACRAFLTTRIVSLKNLKLIITLGRVAHDQTLTALGEKRSHHKFAHGAEHTLPNQIKMINSLHCSRLNTNTGRLTPEMFHSVFAAARSYLSND